MAGCSRESRTVNITKIAGNDSLGFNIVGGESGEGIYISHLLAGGAADLTTQLKLGDQILQVDGCCLLNATHEQAVRLLKNTSTVVQLIVASRIEEFRRYERRMAARRDQHASAPANASPIASRNNPSSPLPNGSGSGRTCSTSSTGDWSDSASASPSTNHSLRTNTKKTIYVRAQFEYDANRDPALPSRGLHFSRGTVLHVLNASDDEWWQARLVAPNEARDCGPLGIVPSRRRVERKERARLKRVNFDANRHVMMQDGTVTLSPSTGRESRKTLRKLFLKGTNSYGVTSDCSKDATPEPAKRASASSSLSVSDTESDDLTITSQCNLSVRSYEAVTRYELTYTRPVVFLGPLKERIIEKLLIEQPDQFAPCVPHTSRPARENEVGGRDYHFVASREEMEQQIDSQLFVEAGHYNGHLYGTSIAAVRCVAESGRHCVLDVSCNAVKRLHAADLYPIVILLKPRDAAWILESSSRRMSQEQALRQLEKSARIEHEFADLLTATLTSSGTFEQLYADVKRVVREHSGRFIWLPSNEPL